MVWRLQIMQNMLNSNKIPCEGGSNKKKKYMCAFKNNPFLYTALHLWLQSRLNDFHSFHPPPPGPLKINIGRKKKYEGGGDGNTNSFLDNRMISSNTFLQAHVTIWCRRVKRHPSRLLILYIWQKCTFIVAEKGYGHCECVFEIRPSDLFF